MNTVKSQSPCPENLPGEPSYVLHKQLKKILLERVMSFRQLSLKSSVPTKTLYHWTSGQRPRKIEQVYKVAVALGVSMEFLVFGEDAQKNYPQPSDQIIILKISSAEILKDLSLISEHQRKIIFHK